MLTLPIKGKYFKMIESGEKPEEYRNITPYYMSRFKNIFEMYPYSQWNRPPHNTFTERLRRYVPDTGSSLYS